MSEITKMPISSLASALEARELSSSEITRAYLCAIEAKDPEIGAYLSITAQAALAEADASDSRRARSETRSPLDGIPMAIKDNICTKGIKTTCASKMLESFVPPYQATVAEKLRAGGAVMLGKLNMDEFAMGSSTENSAFHPTRNPADTTRVPGGSSGGSAAAVAAECAAFTLGSDTGGSVRQPASFCGVVGMKPTYGSVSRYGLVAFASSLDQIGPLTKNVADCGSVLQAISGHDPLDSTSVTSPAPDFLSKIRSGIKGMKIALPDELFDEGISADVRAAVERSVRICQTLGADIEVISMPSLKNALPAYYVISSAEASANLSRFDGVRYGMRADSFSGMEELYMNTRSQGFGAEVKRRIMLGTFTLSAGYYDAYYKKALQVRTLITREFERVFEKFDLILSPTAPDTAWRFGEKSDPMGMYLSDIFTVPANIAGIPALSMPCGVDSCGLPVGLQLMGRHFSEALILKAAYAIEQELGGASK